MLPGMRRGMLGCCGRWRRGDGREYRGKTLCLLRGLVSLTGLQHFSVAIELVGPGKIRWAR
jgi:hypothetical protein